MAQTFPRGHRRYDPVVRIDLPSDVQTAPSEAAPIQSGREPASFERQFRDFGDAIRTGRKPLVGGEEGYQALEIVQAVYNRAGRGRT